MKQITIGPERVAAPAVIQGCMRIGDKSADEVERLIEHDLACGICFFDHADIYGEGRSEAVFGEVLKRRPDLRQKLVIQTKYGIRQGYYDFSKEHIRESVEGSLRRLNCERIDYLLLHRPDALMEPEEVAEVFDELHASGKVAHFGVSNQNPYQMELLRRTVRQPLEINQLQFGPAWTALVDAGLYVNTGENGAVVRDGGALDYCRLNGMTVQAWSPYQHGLIEGPFFEEKSYAPLCKTLEQIGENYGVGAGTVAIAWILRHPAQMQAVIGSTNPERIAAAARAGELTLTREEWYEIYRAAGHEIL